MIEEIRNLLSEKKYDEAAALAEKEIHRIEVGDLITRLSDFYNELVGLRIAAYALAKKTDDLVHYTTWKHKYPHTEKIEFASGNSVTLTDENITFVHSDAYINTTHAYKYFDYNQRSFSNTILKELGKDEIALQIQSIKQNQEQRFYIISHPTLSAPMSYNIPAVEGEGDINLESLKKGLINSLNDAKAKGLGKISIAALGMETNPWDDKKEQIIQTIADCLEEFFNSSKSNKIPEIVFPFITVSSYNAFRDVFTNYSEKGKCISRYNSELNDTQNILRRLLHTNDSQMLKIVKSLSYVINDDFNILFLGESGTGKSYLAEELHKLSNRKDKPFKSLNCTHVSHDQLATHVFGWAGKVYHGSPDGGKSIFEAADEGTVFFDEIGYTDISFQTSLLSFLDKGVYQKAGGKDDYKSTARLIFGTNKNLEELVEEGSFLPDLYERLTSYQTYKLPSLRERRGDLAEILETELEKFNNFRKTSITYAPDALTHLISLDWPGNYRQLSSYIQKKLYNLSCRGERCVTMDLINEDPPRKHSFNSENKLGKLESILIEMLRNWDYSKNGKYLENMIKPILAKIYLHDLKGTYNKSDSNKILGIDGQRAGSLLEQYYEKYREITKSKP